jgi:hypothetical protein
MLPRLRARASAVAARAPCAARRSVATAAAGGGGGGAAAAQSLRAELAAAIAVGAPLYNAGRPGDCYRVYRGAAQRLAGAEGTPPGDAEALRCGALPSGRGALPSARRALAACGPHVAARSGTVHYTPSPAGAHLAAPPHTRRAALIEAAEQGGDGSAAAWALRRAFDRILGAGGGLCSGLQAARPGPGPAGAPTDQQRRLRAPISAHRFSPPPPPPPPRAAARRRAHRVCARDVGCAA